MLHHSGLKRPRSKSTGQTPAAETPAAAGPAAAGVAIPWRKAAAAAAAEMTSAAAVQGRAKVEGPGKVIGQPGLEAAAAEAPAASHAAVQRTHDTVLDGNHGSTDKRPRLGGMPGVGAVGGEGAAPLGDVSARVSSEGNISRGGGVGAAAGKGGVTARAQQQQDESCHHERQQQQQREGAKQPHCREDRQGGAGFGHGGSASGVGAVGERPTAAAGGAAAVMDGCSSKYCSEQLVAAQAGTVAGVGNVHLAEAGEAGSGAGGLDSVPRSTGAIAGAATGGGDGKGHGGLGGGGGGDSQRPAGGLKRMSVSAVKRQRISIRAPSSQQHK